MSENNFNTFLQSENDEIDLAKLMRYVLMQSKMIFSITLSAFIISIVMYLTSTKSYEIKSLLQVESFNQSSLDPTDTVQMISPLRSSADIENLIMLYKSRTNILQIINGLDLNVEIDDISNNEDIDIRFFQNKSDIPFQETFYILPEESSVKIYSDKGNDLLVEGKYGQELKIFDDFSFSVISTSLQENRLLGITYKNPESLYRIYKNAIKLASNNTGNTWMGNDEGLIDISIVTDDTNQGKEIIDYANNIFIDQRVHAETEKSRAAIEFIDENLLGLQKIVDQNKRRLKEFREANKSIDLELETQAIVDKINLIDESLNRIEIELAEAAKLYTSNNPFYINLINKKNIFTSQKNSILSEIQFLPKEQQDFIDLLNQVEITQNLLEELETRRLGFSILEASTIGDIRVVDAAYVDEMVNPRLSSIFLITILAFMSSAGFALFRGANYLPITNPAEIMDGGIIEPVIGVIPFEENVDKIDINLEDNRYRSSLEAAIVNIRSLEDGNDGAKTISITSPTPLNGKSTTSKNLAQTLSLLGKKVLLIDADFKRGKLGKNQGMKAISEKTFFNLDPANLDKFRVSENFYLLPRVKGSINSFHFICSPLYTNTIEALSEKFDYIIFDTAPLLSVADTSVILKMVDINLMVIRHEINKIGEIKQTLDMYNQINASMNGFIYNAYAKPKGYYGYYGLYGNYAYSYYSEKYLSDTYEYKS